MSHSKQILGRYISPSVQEEILSSLIETEDYEGISSVLSSVELTEDVSINTGNRLSTTLGEVIAKHINDDDGFRIEKDEQLIALLKVCPKLKQSNKFMHDFLGSHLSSFILSHITTLFDVESQQLIRISGFIQASSLDDRLILDGTKLLDILEVLVQGSASGSYNDLIANSVNIGKLLFLLLLSKDEKLSNTATSLFKWWIPSFAKTCKEDVKLDITVWSLLRNLLTESAPITVAKNGYVFCLRMLMEDGFSTTSQSFAQSKDYWNLIQSGLNQEVHEIKKIVLSIMKLSLQLLAQNNLPILTDIIQFSGSRSEIESWKKFTTLYEIVGIDTALNQCEAAAPDILDIFGDPNVHASWGLIILSTGLRATMESVRKFTLRLMLQIKNKAVFNANTLLLCEVFLPATMQASFFNVTDEHCEYGESVANFVAEILLTSDDKGTILELLLNALYDCRNMFDAGRIYIAYGVLCGVEKLKERVFETRHIEIIRKLFLCRCEENILQTTIQSIYLKYMLFSNLSAPEFLQTLAMHVKSDNGYEYICRIIDSFRDFCIVNYNQSLEGYEIPQEALYQVLAYELFDCEPYEISDQFLIEIVKADCNYSNLSEEYYGFLTELVAMESNNYKEAKVILDLPQFTPAVYGAINPLPIFKSLFSEFLPDKFDFFVSLFDKVMQSPSQIIIFFEDLLNLYRVIGEYIRSENNLPFKLKDEIYANFFKLLRICIKSSPLTEEQLNTLLALLQENAENDNGNYLGNLEISYLCQSILDVYILPTLHEFTDIEKHVLNSALGLQCRIWDSLIEERLVLNQQPLHLALIRGIFHNTTFLSALNDQAIFKILLHYATAILDQAFSRRTLKPVLSQQILGFMEAYGSSLPNQQYSDFSRLLSDVFTHESMNLNIYNLKPAIAKLFDSQLGLYIDGGLYKFVYGATEVVTKSRIIKALLCSSKEFKRQFLQAMLQEDPNMLKAKKKTDGPEEIQRLQKWQLCLLSIKSVDKDVLTGLCSDYIIPSLVEESSPLVRVYSEWFISYDLWMTATDSHKNPNEDFLFKLLEDTSRPVLQASVERLLFLSLKAAKETGHFSRLMEEFVAQLITNCSSNKPLIRHFSNSLILLFWPTFKDDIKDNILRSIISKLYSDAKKIQVQGQFRAGDANTWSINNDLKLTSIFGGVLLKIMDHKVPYINSKIFKAINIDEGEFEIGSEESKLWLSKRSSNLANSTELAKNSPLQTKSGAWEAVLDFDNQKSIESVTRSELIVIASLVDKAPNLGGICRLCDVLGVGTMTIHDIRVKQHPQFKNVAVTADRWMPIEEVPVDGIISYMNAKKLEGYTLIGLEQTDSSIQLNSEFKFPSKSVILLGTEAHGIPGHLLKELDLCLEIKQSGVIRSMNIQTATAVIVYSYSIQHL
ncbi:Trm3 [Kluyveromyces lactis]|nr:Trm3 [Kluyveromyces lactis]